MKCHLIFHFCLNDESVWPEKHIKKLHENISIYASLLFFSMLYAPISLLLGIFFTYISRRNEFSADQYSVETAKMPESMISSLKKLSKENLSNLPPHWLNVFLNYTHPPVLERI